jgi:pilus assembly protein CpaB
MRRVVTLAAAVVLAAVGTILLVLYVRGAEERALRGQELASVYVVSEPVGRGASLETVRRSVTLTELPVFAVAGGAVSNLEVLEGRVPAVNLIVGEQLIAQRFVVPEDIDVDTRIEVPPDLLQFTIQLSPQRTIGGMLRPGDLVAVIASFDPFTLTGVDPDTDSDFDLPVISIDPEAGEIDEGAMIVGRTPSATRVLLNKVMVTGVQHQTEDDVGTDRTSPGGNLLVTLAATAEDAERILFTMEFGRIWLARQDADSPEPETEVLTRLNIFRR